MWQVLLCEILSSQHMLIHTGEALFRCDHCQKAFVEKYLLKYHIVTHLGRTPTHKCVVCRKSFTSSRILQQHFLVHTGDKLYKGNWPDGNKAFTMKSQLRYHLMQHNGDNSHRCEICGKSFVPKKKFKDAFFSSFRHAEIPISVCQKKFRQKSSINVHMRIHSGEMLFRCELFGKSFRYSTHLRCHQIIHTGEKPYSCAVCNRAFTQLGSLMNHNKIHTGEKPYTCETCVKSFLQETYFRSHMLLHIGQRTNERYVLFHATED